MSVTYSVQFVGYVIQDEFTEYHMKVTSSDNTSWLVRRRYREFRDLHDHLKLKYPERMPSVPGKKLWGNQDPDFVRQRQDQLQVYMNGVLAIEPDCRTRVLQRFLEIRRPSSGGSPLISSPSVVSAPVSAAPPVVSTKQSPQVIPTVPVVNKQQQMEELNRAVQTFQKEAFDLSITPSLLDSGEYASRHQRYLEMVASAKATVPEAAVAPRAVSGDLKSQFAVAAYEGKPELGKAALESILGKAPIATESDLVAFFSMKAPAVPVPASSSVS
jgi:hypothetical protein